MCISTARARAKFARRGSQALGPWHCHCKFSHRRAFSGDPAKFLSKRSLHDPVQVLHRRSCGDPGETLSKTKRSLHDDLADAMSYRCLCESSLVGGSWGQDLARSAPAAAGPFMKLM